MAQRLLNLSSATELHNHQNGGIRYRSQSQITNLNNKA